MFHQDQDHETHIENNWIFLIFFSVNIQFSPEKPSAVLQIQYSLLSIKNRLRVQSARPYEHARTWLAWAVVGGQRGGQEMHILKVIDWKELTWRHSEEFNMQAWHANPRIRWDGEVAAWEKFSRSHTDFMLSSWADGRGQILWNIYEKQLLVWKCVLTCVKSLVCMLVGRGGCDVWRRTMEGANRDTKSLLLLLSHCQNVRWINYPSDFVAVSAWFSLLS